MSKHLTDTTKPSSTLEVHDGRNDMSQHDRSGPIDEATEEDPLGAFGEFLAGMVDGVLSALDDEGVDLGPLTEHPLTEDCWCEPEVEHVEAETFAIGDEVRLDGRRSVRVMTAPDGRGCVVVRADFAVTTPGSGWEWLIVHPRRLSVSEPLEVGEMVVDEDGELARIVDPDPDPDGDIVVRRFIDDRYSCPHIDDVGRF